PVPEPRARRGGELPQADRGDGRGPAGHPDQARRPAAQPAHDRVPGQAEAAAEGAGDARGVRADREEHVREAALVLQKELDKVDIPAEISGRAKHFYSIYDKMVKKGREF